MLVTDTKKSEKEVEMADRIQLNGICVYLEAILGYRDAACDTPIVLSYYDRSQATVKAFGANLSVSNVDFQVSNSSASYRVFGHKYDSYLQPVIVGKERFYHGLSVERTVEDEYLLIDRNRKGEMIYDWLMNKYDLPLLREWGDRLADQLECQGYLREGTFLKIANNCVMPLIPMEGEEVPLDQIDVYKINLTQSELNQMVSHLLKKRRLCITDSPQAQLGHSDVNSYFERYGASIVANLKNQIHPLIPTLDGEAHDFTLNDMRLYPQQIAQLNGDVALLEHGNYCVVNHGMGTGKTVMGAAACDSFFIRKWLRSHPGCTLKDAYKEDGVINYRIIIMCPGHLVKKWYSEIKKQIPFAKATIIHEFKQLLELRERGRKPNGKEFYVISRDFSKLSFQSKPSPTKRRVSVAKIKRCKDCGTEFTIPGSECPSCHSKQYELKRTSHIVEGMVCPHCNNVVLPYKFADITYGGEGATALDFSDFTAERKENSKCFYCDEQLWQPHVANIGADPRNEKWIRVTHYANKTHKGKKTVWVHRDYMQMYLDSIGEEALNILDPESNPGIRKYAPAEFIKRYLRGYFDIAIFDEAQELKGGSTGQGHAMHCLVKASKKQVAMTGTIAGGYADDLFYLLFRLNSKRMVDHGFSFESELAFSEQYGRVEKSYQYEDNGSGDYNASCKGRQRSTPKVKPGINPMIFLDFLYDKTTFLDLMDMSKYLPKLKEQVVSVPVETEAEQDMIAAYRQTVDTLKRVSKDTAAGGFGVLSQCLQFSLSYPDKPYGLSSILSPRTGAAIAFPKNIDVLSGMEWENLSSKEKKLVEIVNEEISNGRGVFIYAEYTRKPETCVTYRLQEILERYCNLKGKVAVLESSTPAAAKREEWVHKRAKNGVKVFITNPRCVATGLDFCWQEDGVEYNYPTLIFYQLGYSLFVIWQASRRAYRLNQRKPCKNIYLAWEGTAQEAVISLIAEKQAATAAIQGHFSAEGLAAMAQGVDTRVKLAAALADMDSITGEGLQDMFDVLAAENGEDESMYQYKPMLLYRELMGEAAAPAETFEEIKTDQMDLFALIAKMEREQQPAGEAAAEVPVIDVPETMVKPVLTVVQASIPASETLVRYQSGSRKLKKQVSGQLALF